MSGDINPTVLRVLAWTGPALTAIFAIGLIPLAGFVPPPDPTLSAQGIKHLFNDDATSVRLGCILMSIAMTMISPWGIALAASARRAEKGMPILFYVQIASVAICTLCAVMLTMVWGTAAFRPDGVSADTTRMLNDFAWFLFLFDWAPFSVWMVAFGVAVLMDKDGETVFPRWVGFMSLWMAFLVAPAGLMIFFKTGAFAFNGLIAMYIPTFLFFCWIVVNTWCMVRAPRSAPAAARAQRSGLGRGEEVTAG